MSLATRNVWRRLVDDVAAVVDGRAEASALVDDLRAVRRNPFPLEPGDIRKDVPDALAKFARRYFEASPSQRELLVPLLSGAALSVERLLTATVATPRYRADVDG